MSEADVICKLLDTADYEPIGDYAVVGNCRSAALISKSGSVDWLCLPFFSSASLFAALLDRRRGGRFLIRPRNIVNISRSYVGTSAVLETVFHCRDGIVKLTDFMPYPIRENEPLSFVRTVECTEGSVDVDVAYQPRPDYAEGKLELSRLEGDGLWHCHHGGSDAILRSDAALEPDADAKLLAANLHLAAGETVRFVLSYGEMARTGTPFEHLDADKQRTIEWWESWCSKCSYDGPHNAIVMRSCLTLKLLTCHDSGAVMAALTTSLPESFNADRNWDYRYCWLRDTSLLLQSFIDMGFEDESAAFLGWLLKVGQQSESHLQPMYDMFGRPVDDERSLPQFEGYRGHGPCRVGNSANGQLQLDLYGELIQTAFRFVTRGGELNEDERRLLIELGDAVCRLWRQPDQSIWETRTPPRHYTYSKLMCWVALDRLIKLADRIALAVNMATLQRERDALRRAIDSDGFSAEHQAYVGYFGSDAADASLLLMVRYGYLEPDDPRAAGTYRHIVNKLSRDGLLYRYPPGQHYDGVQGGEGFFAVCSFWEVDYLARTGQVDAAVKLFERLLGLANDVGLYSEQFDVESRRALGNFPQAFSHAGLVTAGLAIGQAMQGRRGEHISS